MSREVWVVESKEPGGKWGVLFTQEGLAGERAKRHAFVWNRKQAPAEFRAVRYIPAPEPRPEPEEEEEWGVENFKVSVSYSQMLSPGKLGGD